MLKIFNFFSSFGILTILNYGTMQKKIHDQILVKNSFQLAVNEVNFINIGIDVGFVMFNFKISGLKIVQDE